MEEESKTCLLKPLEVPRKESETRYSGNPGESTVPFYEWGIVWNVSEEED